MADDNIRVPPFQITPPPAPMADKAPLKTQPNAVANRKPADKSAAQPHPPKDSVRDIVETIVFVVVLVLLLKTFVAEAFVIPTGSMATTLWGYQKDVTCPQCRYTFPLNCSSEVDPQEGRIRTEVTHAVCPNCEKEIDFKAEGIDPSWHSGDRVLVAKFLPESGLRMPRRFDVVVFKYPGIPNSPLDSDKGPQRDHVPINYIKRLIGLSGETIGIYYGDLYVAEGLHPPAEGTVDDLRSAELMNRFNEKDSSQLKRDAKRRLSDLGAKHFRILRKAPDQIIALSRIVYDNEFQAEDLVGKFPPRWSSEKESGWQADDSSKPKVFKHAGAASWLNYSHLPRRGEPQLITDLMGYNTFDSRSTMGSNWVGDLILDCTAKIEAAEGELVLALNKGVDRFDARFDLKEGQCRLVRVNADGEQVLASQSAPLHKPGEFRLRFANVDRQLTVWVNDELLFGEGVPYDPPQQLGPAREDLQPARIRAAGGAVTISKLLLRRDTYYTVNEKQAGDASVPSWTDPEKWAALRDLPARAMFVQPGHYLCLGDNSPASSDSRYWGTVPESLMLGRALVIYFPFGRVGLIK